MKGAPVAIGHLERFLSDWARQQSTLPKDVSRPASGRKSRFVGAGPAGLTAPASSLNPAMNVTIYEALHQAGGVLVYGIPSFACQRIVDTEVGRLEQAGVKIECNMVIGRTYTLPNCGHDSTAVFIANGAGLPCSWACPARTSSVYSANEYLTRVNLMAAYEFPGRHAVLLGKRVAVIGGGNVAMDSHARQRLGAESSIVYRRTRDNAARAEEVHTPSRRASASRCSQRRSRYWAIRNAGSPA